MQDRLLRLYEAAGDPARWQDFLADLCALTGASASGLLVHDTEEDKARSSRFPESTPNSHSCFPLPAFRI